MSPPCLAGIGVLLLLLMELRGQQSQTISTLHMWMRALKTMSECLCERGVRLGDQKDKSIARRERKTKDVFLK